MSEQLVKIEKNNKKPKKDRKTVSMIRFQLQCIECKLVWRRERAHSKNPSTFSTPFIALWRLHCTVIHTENRTNDLHSQWNVSAICDNCLLLAVRFICSAIHVIVLEIARLFFTVHTLYRTRHWLYGGIGPIECGGNTTDQTNSLRSTFFCFSVAFSDSSADSSFRCVRLCNLRTKIKTNSELPLHIHPFLCSSTCICYDFVISFFKFLCALSLASYSSVLTEQHRVMYTQQMVRTKTGWLWVHSMCLSKKL